MAAHDVMFQEAMNAIRAGERNRARDLLTRLIKADRNQVRYWLWMSTVVETGRERIFCLKEVLRIDPQHIEARRGLILMGAESPDENLAVPLRLQKRNWQAQLQSGGEPVKMTGKISKRQAILIASGLLVISILAGIALFPKSNPVGTSLQRLTAVVSSTPEISSTPLPPTHTLTPAGLQPLVMMLDSTYTPTPLYVNTPHPRSEAYRSALFAYQRGEWASVLSYMQQVSTLEPNAPDIYYYIGEAHRFQQRYTEAIVAYNQAIEISPIFAPAYLGRARAALSISTGRWAAATQDLETALSYDPNLGDAYLELAQIDLDHRSHQDVLDRLEPAARLLPDSPLLYYYRAQAYLRIEEPELALADALRVQQLDKTFLPGYRLIGEVYQQVGDSTKALDALQTYTRYEEQDAEAYYWLGLAYQSNGEKDRALDAFSRAISLDSRLPGVHYERGMLYLKLEQADKAVTDLREAQRRKMQDYSVNIALGRAYLLLERYPTAYSQFSLTEPFAVSPYEKAELYFYRAQTLMKLNEKVAAARDWNALLAVEEEGIPAAWITMAREWLHQYFTPTPTPVTPSPTSTRQPTLTFTATATRMPTLTPTATFTRQPTATNTMTQTRQPTRTPTPTPTPK
jgi:tetratricopeptide (TPR) repeat protein